MPVPMPVHVPVPTCGRRAPWYRFSCRCSYCACSSSATTHHPRTAALSASPSRCIMSNDTCAASTPMLELRSSRILPTGRRGASTTPSPPYRRQFSRNSDGVGIVHRTARPRTLLASSHAAAPCIIIIIIIIRSIRSIVFVVGWSTASRSPPRRRRACASGAPPSLWLPRLPPGAEGSRAARAAGGSGGHSRWGDAVAFTVVPSTVSTSDRHRMRVVVVNIGDGDDLRGASRERTAVVRGRGLRVGLRPRGNPQ